MIRCRDGGGTGSGDWPGRPRGRCQRRRRLFGGQKRDRRTVRATHLLYRRGHGHVSRRGVRREGRERKKGGWRGRRKTEEIRWGEEKGKKRKDGEKWREEVKRRHEEEKIWRGEDMKKWRNEEGKIWGREKWGGEKWRGREMETRRKEEKEKRIRNKEREIES